MSIDRYPVFTQINISQKYIVEKITSQFPPYSDFNFTSLFCWNTDGTTEISEINGNLIIRLPDYITGKPAVSILGVNKVDHTISTLLHDLPLLKMVPESTVGNIKDISSLVINEDMDNFDYIYSNDKLSKLEGGEYKWKRKKFHRFERRYGELVKIWPINFDEVAHRTLIITIFDQWAVQRERDIEEINAERSAISLLLENYLSFNLIGLFIAVDGENIGFSINEGIDKKMAICHFHKSVLKYDNLDIFFSSKVAEYLFQNGFDLVNWEQDLGIPGLRHSKVSYSPVNMLKKYTISKV